MPRVRSRDPLSLLDTSASIDYCRPEHNTPEATAYQLSTVDQGRRKTLTEQISHSQIAGCAPLGVLGLGPCRAGRHAGTVMVSNGHPEHEKLCVRRSTSKIVKSALWIAI